MSTKHTPGPWSYNLAQTHPTAKTYTYEISTYAYDVASATPHVGIRKEADARLMAAAPDLLEALEDILAVEDGAFAPRRPGNANPVELWSAALSKARAALAKAKGEE